MREIGFDLKKLPQVAGERHCGENRPSSPDGVQKPAVIVHTSPH
jgi:hypothetical protein